jgi:hypothetical protein
MCQYPTSRKSMHINKYSYAHYAPDAVGSGHEEMEELECCLHKLDLPYVLGCPTVTRLSSWTSRYRCHNWGQLSLRPWRTSDSREKVSAQGCCTDMDHMQPKAGAHWLGKLLQYFVIYGFTTSRVEFAGTMYTWYTPTFLCKLDQIVWRSKTIH